MEPSTWLLLGIGALIAYWIWDYIRHYLSKCRTCKGSGVLYSENFPKQYRPCPTCKRKGEVRHSFAPKD